MSLVPSGVPGSAMPGLASRISFRLSVTVMILANLENTGGPKALPPTNALRDRSLPANTRGFLKQGGQGTEEKGIDPTKTHNGFGATIWMKARTLAITRSEVKPAKARLTVWFASVESFAKVLSQRKRELLEIISREQPSSLNQPTELAGCNKSNLSCALKTMSHYGISEQRDGEGGTLVSRVLHGQVCMNRNPETRGP